MFQKTTDNKVMRSIYVVLILSLFAIVKICAQTLNSSVNYDPYERVSIAPKSVFNMFRQAGMNPVNHELTDIEKAKVENAFALLPPLHEKILMKHLQSISFMDNMPNSALTSPVTGNDSIKMFNVTFRANVLNETISEWATWKENTCYDGSVNSGYQIKIQAGELNAFLYLLLHEATHIVDAVLKLTPHTLDKSDNVTGTTFTDGIWDKLLTPSKIYSDSLLEKTRFRSGKSVSMKLAPAIYKRLEKTPFVSLYGMASWQEDIAELETIHHLTSKLRQPFYIQVYKNNNEIMRFEPMKNSFVRRRLKKLKVFYRIQDRKLINQVQGGIEIQ